MNNFGDAAMQNPEFAELVKILKERSKRTRRRRALRKKAEHGKVKN